VPEPTQELPSIAAEDALALLRDAVSLSPADETAISFRQMRRLSAGSRQGSQRPAALESSIVVRVIEAKRLGVYRAAAATPTELERALRNAMAQARAASPLPAETKLTPDDTSPVDVVTELHDSTIAELEADGAQERLRALANEGEGARIEWSEASLTVVTSKGLTRQLRATAASLEVRCGRHAGAGSAAAAARSLEALDAPRVFARARARDGNGEPAAWFTPSSVVLSPEAMAALVAAFGEFGLTAAAWDQEHGFVRSHHGKAVLAPLLTIVEDGSREAGLPFPLDAAGARRRAATLVAEGVLNGPVADPLEAARLGVQATRPAVTGAEERPEHLFALPGGVAEDDLLAAADGGIFVAHLDALDCRHDGALTTTAVARGVHRIARGALAEPLPDAAWSMTLPSALAAVQALGNELVVVAGDATSLGGTAAPAALLTAVGDWRPL
jgi:predicted Zn-dependent protease